MQIVVHSGYFFDDSSDHIVKSIKNNDRSMYYNCSLKTEAAQQLSNNANWSLSNQRFYGVINFMMSSFWYPTFHLFSKLKLDRYFSFLFKKICVLMRLYNQQTKVLASLLKQNLQTPETQLC